MISENYQIELRHYTYFMVVAEELHFRKAAERLFISQPGLSTQIKQMEDLLGVRLFERDKKKVTLTPAGNYLKNEVNFVLNHLAQVKKQVKGLGEGLFGEVRIGFLGSAMQQVIPELLLKLQKRHPDIRTSLDELSNRAQINGLLRNELDLGFVRLGQLPKELLHQPVFEDTFSLVLPQSSTIDQANFEGMRQVAMEDFVLFSKEYSPLYFDTVMSICEDAGFYPKVTHKSVHAQTIFRLVENGLGVAIVPSALQHGFQMRVKFIVLDNIRQRAVLSAVWRRNNRNPVLPYCLKLLTIGAQEASKPYF